MGLFSYFANFDNNRSLKKLEKIAAKVEALDEKYSAMTDDELKSEFSTFSYSVSKTGKITFGALYGYHDDRIISLALANLCRKEKGNTSKEYVKIFKR